MLQCYIDNRTVRFSAKLCMMRRPVNWSWRALFICTDNWVGYGKSSLENHFLDYFLPDCCLSRNKYQRLAFPFCVDVSGRLSTRGKLFRRWSTAVRSPAPEKVNWTLVLISVGRWPFWIMRICWMLSRWRMSKSLGKGYVRRITANKFKPTE